MTSSPQSSSEANSLKTSGHIPVVVALLLRDGAVLMGQRSEKKIYPLHWEFPGGKVEQGETLLAALHRELREELAIEATDGEQWFEETATYSNGHTYFITYFLVREFKGEPQNLEFHDVRWLSLEDMDALQHLSGNFRILERLKSEGIPR